MAQARAVISSEGELKYWKPGGTRPEKIQTKDPQDARVRLVQHVTEALNDPFNDHHGPTLNVKVDDPETGVGILTVTADGSVTRQELEEPEAPEAEHEDPEVVEQSVAEHQGDDVDDKAEAQEEIAAEAKPEPESQPETRRSKKPAAAAPQPKEEAAEIEESEEVAGTEEEEFPSRKALRETSFLTAPKVIQPATIGWRGILTKLGISIKPSDYELAMRDDIHAVSQHWPGPRTIAVVNRKGGANKTPTVCGLSAVFARYGGGGVLAWDNNESQGTLGWRTEQGPHHASVLDLLRDKEELLSPGAHNALLAHYVHHQTEDKYDVLRSDEREEGDHEIQAHEVDSTYEVAAKYYRMIFMDSGNTTRAANWRAAIEHTDQLVVATTTVEDRAEAAKNTLVTLSKRDAHSAKLAANAVVIISQEKQDDGRAAQEYAEKFRQIARAAVVVPHDPAMKSGQIRYSALKPATQRAWLAAAAAVARGL